MDSQISGFLRRHFRHFNSATVIDAADGWRALTGRGGHMLLTMAGAMSTARIGLSLAELIRRGQVHGICCTGANLEEDLFNIVGRPDYVESRNYRDLTPHDEADLVKRGLSRITDVCVPRDVFIRVEEVLKPLWAEASKKGERYFPHEFLYRLIRDGRLNDRARLDWSESWMAAACEKNLPIFVPGWEDSTLGNSFAAMVMREGLKPHTVKTGVEYMMELANWYEGTSTRNPIGFFQIGGGITGDFAICVVPMLTEDLKRNVPMWSYFCQISDSTTSYGSYSGAPPREKITWAKLACDTPSFVIESDATIVFPLVAALVMGL